MPFLCRVLQKTEQIVTCVKVFRNVSLFQELHEWFGKLGQMKSYSVLAIEKNCNEVKRELTRRNTEIKCP